MSDIDMAPPPPDRLTLSRLDLHGWLVEFDGAPIAAFSNVNDLSRWLVDHFGPQEQPAADREELPQMFDPTTGPPPPRRSMWRILNGGQA